MGTLYTWIGPALAGTSFLLPGLVVFLYGTRPKPKRLPNSLRLLFAILLTLIGAFGLQGLAVRYYTLSTVVLADTAGELREKFMLPDGPNLFAGLILYGTISGIAGRLAAILIQRRPPETSASGSCSRSRPTP